MKALLFMFSLVMIPITLLVALGGILGMLAAYTNPASSWEIAFLGLILPGTLIVNLFLLVYWSIRKKWWSIVPIIVLVVNIPYLLSVFQISFPSNSEGDKTIQIATYNVLNFRDLSSDHTSLHEIVKYAESNEVDILCLQEYGESNQNNVILPTSRFLTLPYTAKSWSNQTSNSNYGIVLLSRYPIINQQNINFDSPTNNAMWADVKIGEDTIRVFNVHLQTTSFIQKERILRQELKENNTKAGQKALEGMLQALKINFEYRSRQAELLRSIIDTTRFPVVVCGDFNDTPASYVYHRIKENLSDGFKACGNGYGYTYRKLFKLFRIDYIFYSSDFQGLSYKSSSLPWSDHNPVTMKIELLK